MGINQANSFILSGKVDDVILNPLKHERNQTGTEDVFDIFMSPVSTKR